MNRRTFLQSISGGLTLAALGNLSQGYGTAGTEKKRLGIAKFSYNVRLKAERTGKAKGRLADHCRRTGLAHVPIANFAEARIALSQWLVKGRRRSAADAAAITTLS